MSLTICSALGGVYSEGAVNFLKNNLRRPVSDIVSGTTPDDFAAVKKSGARLALMVFGNHAHSIMKDLCDDYDSGSERRVMFIWSFSAGIDAYRLHELKKELHGIPFHNAQGCYSNILGEHVLFSMLHFNRQAWRLVTSKHDKKWDRYDMIELRGQRVGIIGYGSIGQACGRLAAAVGMQVTGIRRSAPSSTGEKDDLGVLVCNNDAIDRVIRESDFVVGVLPGTGDTRHFFNKELFSRMKPSAVFINIGRGATQDEADIVEALTSGTIRGAALDVFEQEPLPKSSPLWDLPDEKLLVTAHCADWTNKLIPNTMERFASIFDDYCATGATKAYRVDAEKGY